MSLIIGIAKGLPANISVSIGAFIFTVLLVKALFHNIGKLKALKEDRHVHE